MRLIFALVLTLAALSARCANPTLSGDQTFTGANTFSSFGNSFQGSLSDGSAAETVTAAGGFISGINGKGFSDSSGDGFTANSTGGFIDNGGGGFTSESGGGFVDNGNSGFTANGNSGFTDNSSNGFFENSSGNITIAGSGSFIGNGSGLTNIPASSLVSNTPKTPTAVTLTGSAFTFTNNTKGILECYFSGGTAYSVSKNGVGIYGSLVGDGYFLLQPTNRCAVTYTLAPTFFTNALY